MASNDWLMKRDALHAARKCSRLIEQRLGLKLSMAHPAFISMLGDYANLYGCEQIRDAYLELASLAPHKQARTMREKLSEEVSAARPAITKQSSTKIRPDQIDV